jgi:hypothetical protein
MDYSLTRAKFYLVFPSMLIFNKYSPNHAIKMSEREMEEKIEQYVSQIRQSKVDQNEKWRMEMEELLKNRVPLNRLTNLLDNGKNMRYEIPDHVKDMFEKVTKFSKDLKRVLNDKADLKTLERLLDQSNNYKIITNEMVLLEEGIKRSRSWLEKVIPLKETQKKGEKMSFKQLQQVIAEYKNLPISDSDFPGLKKIFVEASDCLEHLPNSNRGNKQTRTNAPVERISLREADTMRRKIDNLLVYTDEVSIHSNNIFYF